MSETNSIRARYTCGGADGTEGCGWFESEEECQCWRHWNAEIAPEGVCEHHTAYVAAQAREQRRFEAAAKLMVMLSNKENTLPMATDARNSVKAAVVLLAALDAKEDT